MKKLIVGYWKIKNKIEELMFTHDIALIETTKENLQLKVIVVNNNF